MQPAKDDPIQDVPAVDTDIEITEDNPLFDQFRDVFARFQEADKEDPGLKDVEKEEIFRADDDDNIQGEDEEEETTQRLSKKARKAASARGCGRRGTVCRG